jgi:3-oxoacid CoA-transferase A subunit
MGGFPSARYCPLGISFRRPRALRATGEHPHRTSLGAMILDRKMGQKDKIYSSVDAAVADIPDGATIMFGGFGGAGFPNNLIQGLARQAARNLKVISNNCGTGDGELGLLFKNHQVTSVVAAFPGPGAKYFQEQLDAGKVELELVPQGILCERMRAYGAGIPAFYSPVGVGTEVARGKEERLFRGKSYILEEALGADCALIKAYRSDRLGNLIYRKAARNFNPIMATAAKLTIVEVDEIVEVGELDPETIMTPSIFVDRIVEAKGLRFV